jgi:hypothetical protein
MPPASPHARLIAIANALEGMDRASAARLAGMDRRTLRDWVHRYNAEGIAAITAPPRKPRPLDPACRGELGSPAANNGCPRQPVACSAAAVCWRYHSISPA